MGTVRLRDLTFVGLSMNQSAGLSRRNMMLRMMLLSARLRWRKSVKMKPLATQPTPSAPSGPRKKFTPITGCTKEPREICAPSGCGFKEGEEECYDKTQTIVQDAPKEQCSLEPQRTCKHVTKLVPKLEPTEECVDVPKEVCTRSRTNLRKVKKPVVKKWCYVPTEESGLA